MINFTTVFSGHAAIIAVLFLAAGLFFLHPALSPTCKLDMITLRFGVCVLGKHAPTPTLVYPLYTPSTKQQHADGVSLSAACPPCQLKVENYLHAYPHTLKERKLPEDFLPCV